MSTVEGYSLHLYCDHDPRCYDSGWPAEYGGKNKGAAYRDARIFGWFISRTRPAPIGSMNIGMFALCPKHAKSKGRTHGR